MSQSHEELRNVVITVHDPLPPEAGKERGGEARTGGREGAWGGERRENSTVKLFTITKPLTHTHTCIHAHLYTHTHTQMRTEAGQVVYMRQTKRQ